MQIDHINLNRLSVSKMNMRAGKKPPIISDILPSIIRRGVLMPLFVRPNPVPSAVEGCEAGHYEIVAGKRRYFASLEAARQREDIPTLPCIILSEGDDAEALEISMIENMLRQNPDQVTQWESYTRLVKEGRSVEEIADTFALTELQVKRILALGNLLPRIREAYRAEEIDAATVKHLTLASKAQQKAWAALFEDADAYAPRGQQLKAWLFGGASISVGVALFDIAGFTGQIVTNLFEEDGYFADADAFWTAQLAEVEARKVAYLESGWADVQIVGTGQYFSSWEYEKTPKGRGGRVYIQCRDNGEIIFHEGYLTAKEATAKRKGADASAGMTEVAAKRAELTSAMTSYVDLHRHAAVRSELASHPSVALRVTVAHMICGSPLWTVRIADQHSRNEGITESIETSIAETAFDERRRALLACLRFDGDSPTVAGVCNGSDSVPLLGRLLELPDAVVMELLALVMAETLAIGSELIETLGQLLSVDMSKFWQADAVFFDLLRDREVMTCILAEVGGETAASANAKEKGKVIKSVIGDCLTGSNERPKVDGWVPRWMAFPPSAYTERGGVATVAAAKRAHWLATHEEQEDPDPAAPQVVAAADGDEECAEPVEAAASQDECEEERLAA